MSDKPPIPPRRATPADEAEDALPVGAPRGGTVAAAAAGLRLAIWSGCALTGLLSLWHAIAGTSDAARSVAVLLGVYVLARGASEVLAQAERFSGGR